jgi:hypothetical protein
MVECISVVIHLIVEVAEVEEVVEEVAEVEVEEVMVVNMEPLDQIYLDFNIL